MPSSTKALAILTTIGALTLTGFANAQGPAAGAGFETHKQEMLSNMDKRVTALQEARTCIAAAQDQESMKKCHEGLKEDRMAMRHEHMEKKIQRLDARKAKIEAKKQELEKKSTP